MRWVLRGVIAAQVACAAIGGALNRGLATSPALDELSAPAQAAFCGVMILAGPGAIVPAILLAWRAGLSPQKRWAFLVMEAALLFAYFIAILPAVQ